MIATVTSDQIAALKYLIANAKDGSIEVKRILFFLLNSSCKLTREVYITLTQEQDGFTAHEIHRDALAMGSLTSCNCTTHLDQIMVAMGTDLRFSVHYGNFDKDGEFDCAGIFAGFPKRTVADERLIRKNMPVRYTYWLAAQSYSRTAHMVPVTRAALEAIDVTKPGLYPRLEASLFTS